MFVRIFRNFGFLNRRWVRNKGSRPGLVHSSRSSFRFASGIAFAGATEARFDLDFVLLREDGTLDAFHDPMVLSTQLLEESPDSNSTTRDADPAKILVLEPSNIFIVVLCDRSAIAQAC